MKRCMMDLETLGTKPGCAIISIGAVMFDEIQNKLGDTFYVTINRYSNSVYGLIEDPATVKWWGEQSVEARYLLSEVNLAGTPLPAALAMFTEWLATTQYDDWLHDLEKTPSKAKIMDRVEMWGNGSDFDNALMVVAYSKVGGAAPWKFWNNRCYRTLKGMLPQHKLTRVGVHHNALDDAKSQAMHAMTLLRAINPMKQPTLWHRFWAGVKREFKLMP